MHTFRNLSSWLLIYFVATLFFLTANLYALFAIVNPDNIKTALNDNNVYQEIIPAVLDSAEFNEATAQSGDLPIKEPWVREAIQKAFPKADLEQKSDAIIDGTFNWLEGETDRPQFTIDLTANKQQFGQEVGAYAQNRLAGLPRCTTADIPTEVDAYRITCLPFGADPAVISASLTQQIQSDESFIEDPVISSDDLRPDDPTQDPFEQLKSVQSFYENHDLLMWALPLITLLFAVGGYFLSTDRLLALRRLYRSFFISAVGLLLFFLFLTFGSDGVLGNIATDPVAKDIFVPVFSSLTDQARNVYLVFTIVAAALGTALLVIHRRLKI